MKLPTWAAFTLRWLAFITLLAAILYLGDVGHQRWVDRTAGKTFEAVGKQLREQ